jgi:hypothetical protein
VFLHDAGQRRLRAGAERLARGVASTRPNVTRSDPLASGATGLPASAITALRQIGRSLSVAPDAASRRAFSASRSASSARPRSTSASCRPRSRPGDSSNIAFLVASSNTPDFAYRSSIRPATASSLEPPNAWSIDAIRWPAGNASARRSHERSSAVSASGT